MTSSTTSTLFSVPSSSLSDMHTHMCVSVCVEHKKWHNMVERLAQTCVLASGDKGCIIIACALAVVTCKLVVGAVSLRLNVRHCETVAWSQASHTRTRRKSSNNKTTCSQQVWFTCRTSPLSLATTRQRAHSFPDPPPPQHPHKCCQQPTMQSPQTRPVTTCSPQRVRSARCGRCSSSRGCGRADASALGQRSEPQEPLAGTCGVLLGGRLLGGGGRRVRGMTTE